MKDKKIKQVIICRKDLKLDAGRLGAQIAHASNLVITKRLQKTDDKNFYIDNFSPEMKYWMFENFTKVVLACENEHELFLYQNQASEAGLINEIMLETEYKTKCM
jgi:peptidyl-tRNA hydrolase